MPAGIRQPPPPIRRRTHSDRRIRKTVSKWSGSTYPVGFDALASAVAGPAPRTRDSASTSSFNLLRSYVWGLDLSGSSQGAGGVGGLLVVTSYSSSPLPLASSLFPVYDGNGNILSAIDASNGTVAATYEYGPFGEPVKATGPAATANPFRFSTKYTDAETGLLYYGYRYYFPSLRRWLTRDPIEEQGGGNMFAMVGNSPVNYVDYIGLIGTQTVGKCEIIIFVGHGPNDDAPIDKWKDYTENHDDTIPAVIETPDVCSGATAIGCNAGKSGVVTYRDGKGGSGNQILGYSPPMKEFGEHLAYKEIESALQAARRQAVSVVCPKNCCSESGVKIKVVFVSGFSAIIKKRSAAVNRSWMTRGYESLQWDGGYTKTAKYIDYEEIAKCL